MANQTDVRPSSRPDASISIGDAPEALPRPMTEFEHITAAAQSKIGQPTLLPPTAGAAAVTVTAGGVTGSWTTGAHVNALWAYYATRDAYMAVAGVGWVKIFNGSDGAFLNLTTLASQAKQTGGTINYRTEADGMVHEIYLW